MNLTYQIWVVSNLHDWKSTNLTELDRIQVFCFPGTSKFPGLLLGGKTVLFWRKMKTGLSRRSNTPFRVKISVSELMLE